MAHSISSPNSFSPASDQVKTWVRRLVWKMAIATLLLMAIGSATRVMNAGLACPDWPLCYGQLVPTQQMNLQVFLEWFHRLDAMLIGLSAIALVGLTLWFRTVLPRWLPWAASFALFLIVFQGILGGLTVTELLRFDIVTAHLGTALFFFVTLLTIGSCLSDYRGNGTAGKLPWFGLTAAIFIYLQSLSGGLVASQWALHQCFFQGDMCVVMDSHIVGVVPATLATLVTVIIAWRTPALHPALRSLANVAMLLVCLQILIGVATFKLHLQVEPLTVTHQAVGASLLGTLAMFSVFAFRDRQPHTS
ncbi:MULTISPECIES: heme A synthase [Cyanophyceae]|uniref:COX15/CtaA family protein n=1 Tax=Cyanophyceae TaxID=3028117 RepID=UPI00016DC7D7|nr:MULTISPECIES: heme A synthase [Cyanophyceae]ACA99160.1 Cytochrome oxidase assembly protein subfamily [Picosynechococcus sp. PCC 7002]SMH34233.1 cytochrome c oxidase assembly protein subunit 15 [Picosynechococcus sp. OG1]SMQ84567.1 cytochrome c oxidase assembly protein subunit 15 [Synechococcus sp. 7002]